MLAHGKPPLTLHGVFTQGSRRWPGTLRAALDAEQARRKGKGQELNKADEPCMQQELRSPGTRCADVARSL